MADKKSILKRAMGGVMKGANKVNKLTGAEKLVDYASGKIAKRMVSPEARKYVKDDVSGKDALKSAGKVGLSIATVASGAGAVRGAGALVARSAAKKAVAKAAVKNASGIQGVVPGKTSGLMRHLGIKTQGNEVLKAAKTAGQKLTSKYPVPPKKLPVTSQVDKPFSAVTRLKSRTNVKANKVKDAVNAVKNKVKNKVKKDKFTVDLRKNTSGRYKEALAEEKLNWKKYVEGTFR